MNAHALLHEIRHAIRRGLLVAHPRHLDCHGDVHDAFALGAARRLHNEAPATMRKDEMMNLRQDLRYAARPPDGSLALGVNVSTRRMQSGDKGGGT